MTKTKTIALILALLAVSCIAVPSALAAPPALDAPQNLKVTYQTERDGNDYLLFTYTIPISITRATEEWDIDLRIELRENGGPWITADTESPDVYLDPMLTRLFSGAENCAFYRNGAQATLALEQNSYELRVCFAIGNMERSPYSNIVSLGYAASDHPGWAHASEWAVPELEEAYNAALIPRTLLGADMTRYITRAEFAALAVQMYENLTGEAAPSAPSGTFSDTSLDFVLKAYKLGITSGVGGGKFDPYASATREQIAAMLCRAGTVIMPDADFDYSDMSYAQSFEDASKVSAYARGSMIYMVNHDFIKGSGGYLLPQGICTREQAIIITYRMYVIMHEWIVAEAYNRA